MGRYDLIGIEIVQRLMKIGVSYDNALNFVAWNKDKIVELKPIIYFPKDVRIDTNALYEEIKHEKGIGCTRSMVEESEETLHQHAG